MAAVIINEHRVKPSEADFWKSESDDDSRLAGETARHLALRWVVRLRYGLIVGEVALIAVLSFGLQIALPVIVIGPAVGIQALSNWLLGLKMDRLGGNAEHLVGALFGLDTICLTLILALSGGPANPFSLLYLVQITFSAVVLRKLWTWTALASRSMVNTRDGSRAKTSSGAMPLPSASEARIKPSNPTVRLWATLKIGWKWLRKVKLAKFPTV